MTDTVAHRGPDGAGEWSDPERGIAFGHRRLSILDLSDAGAQPMTSRDQRWVITFNGEIYNHRELAADLTRSGVVFRGHSDTEVLVEAIAERGLEATLEAVEGMFAIGVWDRDRHELHLVRDRVGEKPLYWGRAGGAVVFGSSLDALAAHPDFDASIDPDALCGMLRYKYVPSPLSIYRYAHKVPAASIVTVRSDGTVSDPSCYWSFNDIAETGALTPFEGSEVEATIELERILRSSVANRMIADVPVGAFLSGGIDSTTIVALMTQEASSDVQTFTIGSTDDDFDESADARKVAEHLGTKHHELMVSGDDALAVVDQLPSIYDEPFADSSQIPTFLVSRLAREHVTVSLSGDGGDELFGGYNRHRWLPSIQHRMRHVPSGVRRRFASAVDHLGPQRIERAGALVPDRIRPRQLGLKVEKFANVAALDDISAMYLRTVSHWSSPTDAVRRGVDPSVLAASPSLWPHLDDPTDQMMAIDLLTYLPDDILAKVDRATMAVGLEGRIPFLDRRVIEFAARLPTSLRAPDQLSKQIVRDIVYPIVPAELLERPKAGFGIPLDAWLRGPLRPWAEELLSDPAADDHLRLDVVRATWTEHLEGRRNHGHRLWDVLMFLAWASHRRIR